MVNSKAIVVGLVVLFLLAVVVLSIVPKKEAQAAAGWIEPIKGGRAGTDAYFLFEANGSGSAELISLSEKPKTTVVVLSETGIDDETNNRFDEFVGGLGALEGYGMNVEVIGPADIRTVRDSVIIIVNGAMPRYVLDDLATLYARGNSLIYIGKTDFTLNRAELRRDYWLAQLDNASAEKLVIKEMRLGDFLDTPGAAADLNYQILGNRWAEAGDAAFPFSGFSGSKTLFVPVSDGGYYRFIYDAGGEKGFVDSGRLPAEKLDVRATPDIYPWDKAELYFTMNQSTGRVLYTLEKDGEQIAAEELGYVGAEKAFFYTFEFEEPGDYLFWVYDGSGTLGSSHMHVRAINISISELRDVRMEFNVTVDGVPVKTGKAMVSLDGAEEREYSISDGRMSVPVRLKSGVNSIRVKYLEYVTIISYEQTEESLIDVYAKWLIPGVLLVAGVYVVASARRKPTYRLRVERMGKKQATRLKVSPGQITDAIADVEKSCGWKEVPISLKELTQSFKKNITDGMDMYDGDVEGLMKKMEEKGSVQRYGDYYQLHGWGDAKKNVIKRRIRDVLVLAGEKFRDAWGGFELARIVVSTEYFNTEKKLILVFENEEEKDGFLQAMEPFSRAEIELKMENGKVVVTTIDGLSEFI
ncbi:MAG: hypothetical protein WC350_01725 [Candidatus Micrarchaeia archaeon]|jgi:hypothetical protein